MGQCEPELAWSSVGFLPRELLLLGEILAQDICLNQSQSCLSTQISYTLQPDERIIPCNKCHVGIPGWQYLLGAPILFLFSILQNHDLIMPKYYSYKPPIDFPQVIPLPKYSK